MKVKLSGFLNNCALHAGVPSLLENTKLYEENTLNTYQPLNYGSYLSLLTCFARFYGIEHLTFKKFNAFMQSLDKTAQQIVMGPVLRDFMRQHIEDEARKESLTTLQINGKYMPLLSSEASRYAYQYLGISLNEPSERASTELFDYPPEEYPALYPSHTIDLYNREDHFELVPLHRMAEAIDDSGHFYTTPTSIRESVMQIEAYNTKDATEAELIVFKAAVKEQCDHLFMHISSELTHALRTSLQRLFDSGRLTQNHLITRENIDTVDSESIGINKHDDEVFAECLQEAEFRLR